MILMMGLVWEMGIVEKAKVLDKLFSTSGEHWNYVGHLK